MIYKRRLTIGLGNKIVPYASWKRTTSIIITL